MLSMTALQDGDCIVAVPNRHEDDDGTHRRGARKPSLLVPEFRAAVANRASMSSGREKDRTRKIINAPLRPDSLIASQCKPRGWTFGKVRVLEGMIRWRARNHYGWSAKIACT